MTWTDALQGDSLSWLLEHPIPGVRYLALRDLLDLPPDHADLIAAREAAYRDGPMAAVLDAMQPEGFWCAPGPGYTPQYYSTVWALVLLAQLGGSAQHDARIAAACAYLLEHALTPGGQFTTTGAPSGTADCLQGNLCFALLELGYADARLTTAVEWIARTVNGEGIAPSSEKQSARRFYASGKCGPLFACSANNKCSCAWGAAKVMLAFSRLPAEQRTPLVDRAVQAGVNFLLDNHPEIPGYPNGYAAKPSGNWWKFGFPVFYITDMLQIMEAAARLGRGNDPRLAQAFQRVLEKQDAHGRWPLEYHYQGKTYGDYGAKREANPWVTLRVLRMLKARGCTTA
jgi:hypothetical protein